MSVTHARRHTCVCAGVTLLDYLLYGFTGGAVNTDPFGEKGPVRVGRPRYSSLLFLCKCDTPHQKQQTASDELLQYLQFTYCPFLLMA